MIPKKKRIYINKWFDNNQKIKEGNFIKFEMPSFCSGTYEAKIFIDNNGEPYIDKSNNYYKGCRDYYIYEN